MFVCAGNGEEFAFAKEIGVGLIESAINLTRLCVENQPKFLIFIGSAGSYDFNQSLLELYISDEATQIESGFLNNMSYSPIKNHIQALQNVSHETIKKIQSLQFSKTIVNSSNYITTDTSIAEKMKKRGILLENMEFYSVLSVANTFDIPALGVFCVSNYCSPQAHEDFAKNRLEVMRKISNIVEKSL